MTRLRACVCLFLFVSLSISAFAWGPIGHMAVTYVAYQQLTPAAKIRVRDLLKLNPDYPSWEKQIPAGTSPSDHDMMIFMIAATWADAGTTRCARRSKAWPRPSPSRSRPRGMHAGWPTSTRP